MNSVTKETKKFNSNDTKDQIKSILKSLVELNKDKTSSAATKFIRVSQVRYQINRMLRRKLRLYKIYWIIDIKNAKYRKSCGVEEYSARDIYNIVIKLLKNDGQKTVCKRTIERDIKLLNEMGLLESKIIRFGENKGSMSFYKQNMQLAHLHKDIIFKYLLHLLKENLSDKKIVGNFDDSLEESNFNYTNLKKFGILSEIDDPNKSVMSHRVAPHAFNSKANISNNKNSKELLLKNNDSSKPKKEECRFKRNDVETRLTSEHKISKNYLNQIKEYSNNDATYINALINLETAINEYQGEYYIEDILEHFLKQFGNRYKYKIWMMMKRSDGVISDYDLIWEGRFRDWYPNKYKSNCAVKSTYGENLRIGIKKASVVKEKRANEQLNVEELREKEKEKEKESEEQRKRESASLQKYLTGLFEREAKEREERLRKAREEELNLKKKARASMLATLERSKKGCVELGIANNGMDNMIDASSNDDSMVKFAIRDEFGGFKTTKGMSMLNLGIMIEDIGQNENLKEKESK
ncbi:plasmid maintenance protein [Borrelia coriaceae]|nr:plasmid maintenance protein [Borrelia coriaceae]